MSATSLPSPLPSDSTIAPLPWETPTVAEAPQQAVPLLGKSLAELTDWMQQQGQPAYRGKQLHQWLYQQGARSLMDISVFPKQWRTEMADVNIGRSQIHHRSTAPDGTVKFLLRLADGHIIEAVGMPTVKGQGWGGRGDRGCLLYTS
ncbi:hypothetical protein ACN4EK_07490, partial [Pantanalinema rosaneae CENA516]